MVTRIIQYLKLCVFILPFLAACALGPRYFVGVDSIRDPVYQPGGEYILFPAVKGVQPDDLQFREYAGYVGKALTQRGYTAATSTSTAKIAVFVSYGIGDPQSFTESYSMPVYGQVAGGTSNFNAMSFGPSGTNMTYGSVYTQPQYGVVGSQSFTNSGVTYLRFVIIDAIDLETFKSNNKIRSIWKTTVVSRGQSSDLRRAFPVLIGAAAPFMGADTKKQVFLQIREHDDRVDSLREDNLPEEKVPKPTEKRKPSVGADRTFD